PHEERRREPVEENRRAASRSAEATTLRRMSMVANSHWSNFDRLANRQPPSLYPPAATFKISISSPSERKVCGHSERNSATPLCSTKIASRTSARVLTKSSTFSQVTNSFWPFRTILMRSWTRQMLVHVYAPLGWGVPKLFHTAWSPHS